MNLMEENQNLIGIFTTDADLNVQVWDAALERMTGISADGARGRSVMDIIPNLETRGLLTRFWSVLENGTVELLAPAFHRFLIPCPPRTASEHFAEMRQRVTIAPLKENEKIRGLIVTIEDVTARIEGEIELTHRLKNADDAVRLEAAKAISEKTENLSEETSVPIIEALDDKSWRVRRELVEGLTRRAGSDAIAALLRAMQEKHLDFAVLNSALKVLQSTSVRTTEALIEFLEGTDADLRMQAALTLGEQRDEQAIPALLNALEDENINVRFHVIEALGKFKASEAVPKLLEIAETRDFFLSFAALEALREIRDERIAPCVMPLLADKPLREAAVETLGAVGDETTVAPLVNLLNEDKLAALAVSHALDALFTACENSEAVIEHARRAVSESGKSNLLAALDAADENDLPALIRLAGWFDDEKIRIKLADLLENENLRDEAARALAAHGASAAPILIERLDEDSEARPAIIRTLGQIGDARAFESLVGLLETGDTVTRLAAAEALKALAHPETIECLSGLLTDSENAVRETAIRVVGYLGAKSCEDVIFELCEDADERVRRAAIEQLPFIDDERSIPVLIRALKRDSSRVREAAAKALAQFKSDESAAAALREALRDEDSWTRYFAVRALGVLQDTASREKLSQMAESDDAEHVRAAAREVLSGLQN